ncbi:MAG: nucleotide sugar dehydrogenase [Phycisphaerales bacterium]|nr:nucleotide sugar dehydrogenase [Phycisphaerales bacterium]
MTSVYEGLRQKIQNNTATVGIIGLGYVGLPLAHALHGGGLRILGFDIDPRKIKALAEGRNYLEHLGPEMTRELASGGRFEATSDFDRLREPDVLIVCLPTPLGKHHEPDLSYLVRAGEQIGRTLRAGQLIALESTTYPGTTRGEFLDAILASRPGSAQGLECGRDFFLAFSPEREDPGRKSHSTRTIPKLVGGLDAQSTELAAMLYEKGVDQVVRVSSADVAEAAKLLENIFRCVNIAMVNEMKMILSAMDIDVWEVIGAASTKPFGFMPFYPGPGLGGHCIPIDPFYLTWKAKEVGRPTRFIELAGEINTSMPDYVVERTILALNEHKQAIKGARVLVLGLAYKPDIDDTRESPAFEVIEKLRHLGARVDYSDPHVPETMPVRKHDLGMRSVALTPESLAAYDACVLVTDHKAFDYESIARHARLVVDTRNALRAFASDMGGRLVKA